MNKKELEILHLQKSSLIKDSVNLGNGKENRYVLSMSLTFTEISNLEKILKEKSMAGGNPYAADLYAFLAKAIART